MTSLKLFMMSAILSTACLASAEKIDPTAFDQLDHGQLAAGQVFYTSSGFKPFPQWKKDAPDGEVAVLLPYPGFDEPDLKRADGTSVKEQLIVYVAKAKILINKPANQIDLSLFKNTDELHALDPDVTHQEIQENQLIVNEVGKTQINNFTWCNQDKGADGQPITYFTRPFGKQPDMSYFENKNLCGPGSECFESCYKFNGYLQSILKGINHISGQDSKHDVGIASQSEVRTYSSDKDLGVSLPNITHISTPVQSVLVQTSPYFDQIFLTARTIAVIQADPSDSSKSVLTVITGLDILLRSWNKYNKAIFGPFRLSRVLEEGFPRYRIGMAAGIPTYTQNLTIAMANIIDGGTRKRHGEDSVQAAAPAAGASQ
jgi:hypothetical protein